jgi:hypothetical protein
LTSRKPNSPLRHWGAAPGKKVAVVGLGVVEDVPPKSTSFPLIRSTRPTIASWAPMCGTGS